MAGGLKHRGPQYVATLKEAGIFINPLRRPPGPVLKREKEPRVLVQRRAGVEKWSIYGCVGVGEEGKGGGGAMSRLSGRDWNREFNADEKGEVYVV